MADDRPDVTEDTNLQLKAVSDMASRGQIEAERALELEKQIKLNDLQRRKTRNYPRPPSNLPNGVKLSPQGDLGQHRGVEAKIAGAKAFKGSKIMSASKYFRGI